MVPDGSEEVDGEHFASCFAWPPSPPEPGEGLLGWLLREASEQHVPSIGVVLARATPRLNLRAHQRIGARLGVDALADATMTDRDVVARLLYPDVDDELVSFFGASIPRWHLESDRRRFSPKTLAARGSMLVAWEHKFLPFCPTSWEYLTDRCPDPDCTARQTWHWAVGVDRCSGCGGSLSSRARRMVPKAWRARLGVVASLTQGIAPAALGESVPAQLHDADPGEALALIHSFFPLCGERRLSLSTSSWWQRRPARLAATLAGAVGLLEHWPRAFLDRLATAGGRRAVAGIGASAIIKGKHVRRGGAAAKALADLAETMRAHGSGRAVGSDAAYSIGTAARLLGSTTSDTADARRRGLLRTSPMLRGHEVVIGLERSDVDEVADMIRNRVSLWKVAVQLGVPRYAAEDLAQAGALASYSHPYLLDKYGRHVFDARQLKSFVGIIAAGSVADEPVMVSLRTTMSCIGGRFKPWALVLEAIHSGELSFHLSSDAGPIAARIRLHREDVVTLLVERETTSSQPTPSCRTVNRGDALDVMNLHTRHSRAFAEVTGDCETLSADEVLKLAIAWISPTEIRARWKLDPRSAASLLRIHAPGTAQGALGWPRQAVEAVSDHLVPDAGKRLRRSDDDRL